MPSSSAVKSYLVPMPNSSAYQAALRSGLRTVRLTSTRPVIEGTRGVLCDAAVLGEDIVDDLLWTLPPSEADALEVGLATVCFPLADERDQGLPQRPATAARPGRIVQSEAGAERLS